MTDRPQEAGSSDETVTSEILEAIEQHRLIGNFGEVFVMDWGVARVLGQRDQHGIRLRREDPSSRDVETVRGRMREDGPVRDPVVPVSRTALRVSRGGCYDYSPSIARTALRNLDAPEFADYDIGLRPARNITGP